MQVMRYLVLWLLLAPLAVMAQEEPDSTRPEAEALPGQERRSINAAPAMRSFIEKRSDMYKLLQVHLPRLRQLEADMARNEGYMASIDSIMSYRSNVIPYRDSCLSALGRIRGFNTALMRQVQQMYFEWLPYNRELMAVHTRYGELLVRGQRDTELEEFLLLYREEIFLMEMLAARHRNLYNETEFILNAKLN